MTNVANVMENCGKYCLHAPPKHPHHDQHAAILLLAKLYELNVSDIFQSQGIDYDNAFFHSAHPNCGSVISSNTGSIKVKTY